MNDKDFKEFEELNIIKKNDRFMITANTTFLISLFIIIGICIIITIVMLVKGMILSAFIFLAVSALSLYIAYIMFKLFLSMIFDIKMIRNKLYNLDNSSIGRLYDEKLSDMPKYLKTEDSDNSENV